MTFARLSPGIVQAAFDLVKLAASSRLKFSEIRVSFPLLGRIDSGRVIETAKLLNWVSGDDFGNVEVTSRGARLIGLATYESSLRQALIDYIEVVRPAWAQNATFGRSRVLSFADREVAQVFIEAGLAGESTEEIAAFWHRLAAEARGQRADQLASIGRRGEVETISYEKRRTNANPRWVSIDDNADGYDVLSVVSAEDQRPLSIEVKASTMGIAGEIHVTRNEWIRAVEFQNHVFHLWDLQSSQPRVAVVTPQQVAAHIPSDSGEGLWELTKIPLLAFASSFEFST